MSETRTLTQIAIVLGGSSSRRLPAGEHLMHLVPTLTEGALVSADVSTRAALGYVAAELTLETRPQVARIRQRLAFWFAREGGWSRGLEGMTPEEAGRFRDTLERADLSLRAVSPAEWRASVRRIFSAAGAGAPSEVTPLPVLRLHIGGTGWHGFTFEPSAGLLHVPSPLSPPAGDVIALAIEPAARGGGSFAARGTVVSVRRPADAAPRAPAGFTLALDATSSDAALQLAARCPLPGEIATTRAAPRYNVVAAASLGDPGEELRYDEPEEFLRDYVSNLSHGGAFVRTQRPRAVGERVRLHVRLPGREPIGIPATIVHRSADGVGLQFELAGSVEAALCAAVAGLAARPRRALVVDDDAFVRRVLVDALTASGFETLTASDGEAGLRAIVDELLALDAVVTDIHMPGLSGGDLVSAVRHAGGEAELVLVAVTADASDELTARLRAAGADAVVSKELGPDRVVAEVEAALRRRVAAEGIPGASIDVGRAVQASVG